MLPLPDRRGNEVEQDASALGAPCVYEAYGKAAAVSVPDGDVDFDGVENSADTAAIQRNFGLNPCTAGTIYDRTADGVIDWADTMFISWPPQENHAIPASGLGNPYFFTGRRLDVYLDAISNLSGPKPVFHYRARSYDPIHGRFWQRDPAEYVDGMNLYEYVNDRPTVLTDPDGTCPIPQAGDVPWGMTTMTVHPSYFSNVGARLSVGIVAAGSISARIVNDPCCPAIGLVQIARENFNKRGFGKWELDDQQLRGNKVRPWYAFSNPNPPSRTRNFDFNDTPFWDPPGHYKDNEFEQQFEICVVCANKNDRGKYGTSCILNCLTWSHKWTINPAPHPAHNVRLTIDAKSLLNGVPTQNPLGPTHTVKPMGKRPSQDFINVVKPYRWPK